jgi:hypothetical protein
MFTDLNASAYVHSNIFYNAEFEELLSKIIACYNLMLTDNVSLSNDENSIRDVLLINYLNDNSVRRKIELTDYLFNREVPESKTIGRTDIKIETQNTFQNTDAYYTIECKRLGSSNAMGATGLNAKYIQNGISRFVSKTYSSHYKTNGMIGFIVETIDINKNIAAINGLLKGTANTTKELFKHKIVTDFHYSYCSTHDLDSDEILIYHLMFDFSKNIKS